MVTKALKHVFLFSLAVSVGGKRLGGRQREMQSQIAAQLDGASTIDGTTVASNFLHDALDTMMQGPSSTTDEILHQTLTSTTLHDSTLTTNFDVNGGEKTDIMENLILLDENGKLMNQGTTESVFNPYVVGGRDADSRSFYTMLLYSSGYGYRWSGCGGTLISNCHILTAAHCVVSSSNNDHDSVIDHVFVNAHTPFDGNQGLPFHFTSVGQCIAHENFNATTMVADIAIIKLGQCIEDMDTLPPAELAHPYNDIPEGLMLDVLGFGKTSEGQSLFGGVEILQEAQIPFIPTELCRAQYYGDSIKDGMLCAGFGSGGIDACQGDSGGGLMEANSDGADVQIGIVSWGHGCGRDRSPGVYTSVRYYYDWIKDIVCNDEDTDKSIPVCSIPTTRHPSNTPTETPTSQPTTTAPTTLPILSRVGIPAEAPINTIPPTPHPTNIRTKTPTRQPTLSPTASPTLSPTVSPTVPPTVSPTTATTETPVVEESKPNTGMPDELCQKLPFFLKELFGCRS